MYVETPMCKRIAELGPCSGVIMTSSGLQTHSLWLVLPGLGHLESKQKQGRGNRKDDQNNRERTEGERGRDFVSLFVQTEAKLNLYS